MSLSTKGRCLEPNGALAVLIARFAQVLGRSGEARKAFLTPQDHAYPKGPFLLLPWN